MEMHKWITVNLCFYLLIKNKHFLGCPDVLQCNDYTRMKITLQYMHANDKRFEKNNVLCSA